MGHIIIKASIIIPCRNENNNLKMTIDSIMAAKSVSLYEIIVVDDGSEDGSCNFLKLNKRYKNIRLIKTEGKGCANAKNEGALVARGIYYFFVDAHVKVEDYWVDKLVNTLEKGNIAAVAPSVYDIRKIDVVGYGETWNDDLKLRWIMEKPNQVIEIPIACGCAFAIKRQVFNKIDGFNRLFKTWGKEDEEISLKLWLYGYRVVVNPDVKIGHLFRSKFPYEVATTEVLYNTICMAFSHFNKERLAKILEVARVESGFNDAKKLVEKDFNYIMQQRKKYFNERKFDDNYFFEKFNILY